MTYEAAETSADAGRPVELYTFARGTTLWRYTSADRAQVVGGDTFAPAVIGRSRIEQGAEMNRSALKLTVPRDFAIAELYRVAPPGDVVAVTLRRLHLSDADGELATLWTGRVVNVAWSNDGAQATITCEPIYTSLRRTGLRRMYGRLCPHVLYGPACKANPAVFAVPGTLTATTGLTLTAAAWGAKPVGWFDGGFIEWAEGGGTERRFIVAHSGSTLTLDRRAPSLAVGAVATAYPGCEHTLEVCDDKFDNILNNGSTPFIPTKNPMGGDPIY